MPTPAAARPDAIRRHNLSLVLTHIHQDGAITRAELTQRLGVSRSTIGVLVSDLIEHRLVEESVPSGGAGVGRPILGGTCGSVRADGVASIGPPAAPPGAWVGILDRGRGAT